MKAVDEKVNVQIILAPKLAVLYGQRKIDVSGTMLDVVHGQRVDVSGPCWFTWFAS